jgi:ribosomal-protein-alanine N-acetyltransferase
VLAPLETPRLILRPLREEDREPFAAMNADLEVMRFFPKPLDRAESDRRFDRIAARWARDGFSFGAVEVKGQGFVGLIGLNRPFWPPHLADHVEIGWRLARPAWGQGYATEAARAWLAHGFGTLGLDEIVAFTVAVHVRSRAVMERLGMSRDPADDFEDPDEPVDSHLRRLVLYRLSRADWRLTT